MRAAYDRPHRSAGTHFLNRHNIVFQPIFAHLPKYYLHQFYLVATFGPIPSTIGELRAKQTPTAHASKTPHAKLTWEFVWCRDKAQKQCQVRLFDIEKERLVLWTDIHEDEKELNYDQTENILMYITYIRIQKTEHKF